MRILQSAVLGFLVAVALIGCTTPDGTPGVHRNLLLGGASVISSPLKNTNGQLALLVFADDPPNVIGQVPGNERGRYFYKWAYYAFRLCSPKEVWLCSEDLVATEAQRQGLAPSILQHYRKIEHLAFKSEEIPKLCDFAASLGATHVVRVRLLDMNSSTQRETRTTQKPTGITIGSVTFLESTRTTTSVMDVTTATMRIRCHTYQTSDGTLLFEQDFDLYDKSAFAFNAANNANLKKNFVAGVLREIESRTSLASRSAQPGSGSRPVNLAMEVWLREYATDGSYSLTDVGPQLTSIERIDQNLKLNFTVRNSMRGDLHIAFQEGRNGRPEAFLRDEAGATHYAASTSVQGNQVSFRPGERKNFYFVVPLQSSAVKAVNFFAEWSYRSQSQQESAHLRFPNILLP